MRHFRGKKAAFLKALRSTYAIAPAADQAGVHRSTVYRWKADADFADAVRDAQEACLDDLEARHFEAGRDKDTLARIHLLKSHRREVYGDHGKWEVEHKLVPNPPLPFSQRELAALAASAAVLIAPALAAKLLPADPLDTAKPITPDAVEAPVPADTQKEPL